MALTSGATLYVEGEELHVVVRALCSGDWLVPSWWRIGAPGELMGSLLKEARWSKADAWVIVMPTQQAIGRVAAIRASEGAIPVLVASHGSAEDEAALLRVGADSHCRWPDDAAVLGARVHSLLRRASGTFPRAPVTLIELCPQAQSLRVGETEVRLSTTEYRIIERLNEALNDWVPAAELWPLLAPTADRYDSSRLRTRLLRIRQKLGVARWVIRTERGRGVMLTDTSSPSVPTARVL